MPAKFEFDVLATESEGHTMPIAVRIAVNEKQSASDVLKYIRSVSLKNDVMNNWVKNNAPGYGMEIREGPRPVFEEDGNRDSGVIAYEQSFRLTRPI